MKRVVIFVLLFVAWMSIWGVAPSEAQDHRAGQMVLGVDIGPALGTIDDSAFALSLSGDYYTSRNLSVGPLLQMAFTGNLSQFALSGQLKYTFDVLQGNPFRPNVQAGLGFVTANHDNVSGQAGGSLSDTSYVVPIGIGFEYKVKGGFYLSTTALLNFTNLNNSGAGKWQDSLSLMLGVRLPL